MKQCNMKPGDKLVCKRGHKNHIINSVNFVEFTWKHIVYINSGIVGEGSYFTTNSDNIGVNLWDYFYTEKELRKLKLDSINEEG